MEKQRPADKKKTLRETGHLTRPPRLESKAQNAAMNPRKKAKRAPRKSK